MSKLAVTIIDVGWGDSILIESVDSAGNEHYALVDCNDTSNSRSSFLFVKRFFEKAGRDVTGGGPTFDFVMLTHGHADHANGIQLMMSHFRTDWFWYPKSVSFGGFAKIIRYANRYTQKVARHQAIDNTKVLPDLGDVQLEVLWPPWTASGIHDPNNENNNSIVLQLTLDRVRFLLTGDCEAENWDHITLPSKYLKVFQVPHHGANNGVFDGSRTPWLDRLGSSVKLAMSSHIRPHNHPNPEVIAELERRDRRHYRTDQHYHVTFETDGRRVSTQWSRT